MPFCLTLLDILNFIFELFQVLSASGGQIIAVQNPALSLSGALLRNSSSSVSSSHHHDVTASSHHHESRHTNISSTSSPLSTLLNLSRRDEGSNGNDYFHNHHHATSTSSRGASHHQLRELRSSRAFTSRGGANNSDSEIKEEPVSPPRSSTPTLRSSPTMTS